MGVGEAVVTFRAPVGDDGVRRVTARLVEKVACSAASCRGEGRGPEQLTAPASSLPSICCKVRSPNFFRMMPGMRGREMEQPEVQKGSGFTGKTTNTAADM